MEVALKQAIEPAPFQVEDMAHLEARDWSANWSEMGCYKTSTACWLIERWAKRLNLEAPRVLIVTTRSGKGTFFKHVPDLLPNYELINIVTNDCKLIIEGQEIGIGGLPTGHKGPIVCVTHYNVFTRRKKKTIPKAEKTEDDLLADVFAEIAGTNKKSVPMLDQIQKFKWDIIILDEAHRIKSRKTGWTRELKRLKSTVRHVMTGTGFINDPSEIWSLLNFINKQEFSSYWRFREEYCAEDIVNGFRKIVGPRPDTKDKFKQLVREIGPRRTKHEVFKNLPEPIYSPVEVELNDIQRKIYESLRDDLYAMDQLGLPIVAPNVIAALQRLRQICVATPKVVNDYYDEKKERRVQEIELVEPSTKLDALMEIISGLEWDEERRDQVVVFSNFKGPIELAKKRFDKAGISFIEMRQHDNDQTRYKKWAIDFPQKKAQVFICTLQLGSESISLTSASTCVFLDRSWSPKDNSQGESRVWRPGQEEVANMIYINAKNTVDTRIMRTTMKKQRWFDEIFGNTDD